MKVLELFAGTRSIGKAFEAKGHEVFSVEWNKDFENIDLYADISTITAEDIIQKFGRPDVIWASPDCATFSVAAISHHRRKNPITGNLDPISEYAKFCDKVDIHVLKLIGELNPKFFFIENPRGGMRKMNWMQAIPRYTVTYCQYGETRMKPTDIWTNHPNPQFKPPCKNGDSCHEKAPRGSQTGTQGLKTAKEKGVIPLALCQHVVDICEQYIKEKEKKEMELRINEMQLPAPITFNYEELKQEIESKVSMYTNLVYTDEQIQEAKKDKANLNKLKKALNDERIRMEKEYMVPFNTFKAQVNEIIRIIDEPVAVIDKQVKEYEEKQKREKKDGIENFFDSCLHPEWLKFEQIFNEKWLNASVSMKSIQGEIDSRLEQVANDIATLQNLPEFGFEAMEVYKSTLDLNRALNEGRRLSEIAKAKAAHEAEMKARAEERALLEAEKARLDAEAEAKRHIEEFENDMRAQNEAILKGCEMAAQPPAKQWVTFAALMTTEDALALRDFFNDRGIEFKAV